MNLKHQDQEDQPNFQWSPFNICEAFATARGFLTAKSGRPDVHRAANLLLRMVSDGRILLAFTPPDADSKTEDIYDSITIETNELLHSNSLTKSEKKARKRLSKQNQLKKLAGDMS